tara:strand:+ start:127 stop:1302 length:1176 start_codon:yes stop_codon:yes gene_type:complete
LCTITVVGISVISVIFPALILSSTYDYPNNLNTFEISPWLIPILISTISLIVIGFLYKNKKLPQKFYSGIKLIFNFEISKKTSIILGILIISIYVGLSFNELFIDEVEQWPDYLLLEEALNIWPSTDHWSVYIKEQNTRYVRMLLLDFSDDILQNIKLLPFAASILVIIFTSLVTIQLSKKRFAGILSMIVLLQSITFTDFDTIAVYENFWVLFFLLSIYSIQKRWWYASPITFILSVFTKAFVVTYFWINIFYIYRSEIPKKSKIMIMASYGIVIAITYAIFENGRNIIYNEIVTIDSDSFFNGFTGWGNSMQMDPFAILCIIPITVGLFIKSLKGLKQADSILILILGTILAAPLISFVTDFYFILPYRFIPFIIAMAIGVGVLFSKET